MAHQARGFTLIELAACIGTTVVLGGVCSVLQPGDANRKQKDSTHVRAIHQAMVIWAQNNSDLYPLPSKIDTADATVKEKGRAKDTTANIYSLLLYNGFIGLEALVSPMEKNPNIEVAGEYDFDAPKAAVKPKEALWDPAFSVDFTGKKPGHASYAHLQPSGGRLPRWSNTFMVNELVLANRGPEIKRVKKSDDGSVTLSIANPASIAMQTYGGGASWSGWIACNDNSVVFSENEIADGLVVKPTALRTYTDKKGKTWPDLWCYDEPDDEAAANHYLSIFTKAGDKPKDFKAIWD